jgi:hypothetical protein
MRPTAVRCLASALALSAALAGGCDLAEVSDPPTEAAEPEAAPPSSDARRAQAIQDDIRSLRAERDRHGGWDEWSRQVQPYRAALWARIQAAKPNYPDSKDHFAASVVLPTFGEPLLFEPGPAWYLHYIFGPESTERFRHDLPLATASRWFKSQGIDLVFIPVPKMTEAYPERMADHCLPDRIVAPNVRRLMLDLLEQDVEVIDVLHTFLNAPDRDAKPLYLPDDPHWAPRARQMAAEEVARRLKRYAFVRYAQEGAPVFRVEDKPWPPYPPPFGPALTPEQSRRCGAALPKVEPNVVPVREGTKVIDQRSPVLLIGDSYNGGLVELVARELNVPVAIHWSGGQTVQAVVEGVRNPQVFQGRKVVIWTNCNTALSGDGNTSWELPPQLAPFAGKR